MPERNSNDAFQRTALGDDASGNIINEENPLASSVHSMPSFTPYEGNQDSGDEHIPDTASAEEPASKNEEKSKGCMIPTVLAVAVVISLGVITVGLVGFLPTHLIGFRAVSGTAELIQVEAVRGVIILMRSTILQLPDFAYTITANYMRNQTSPYTVDALPTDSLSLMYSLLSVLSTFRDTISFFKFAHTDRLYGLAMEPQWLPDSADLLMGAHDMKAETTPIKLYYPATLDEVSKEPYSYWNIPQDISRDTGPFEHIVKPWEANESLERWLPENRESTGLYFNFVIPFRIHNASGYCEVGMPTGRLLRESQPLIAALRNYGRVMLFDPTENVVILNSWGENVSWYYGNSSDDMSYGFLKLEDIQDPLASSITNHILKNDDNVMSIANGTAELTLPFADSAVRASVARVTDRNGLNIMLMVAVLRSDFFAGIVQARTIILSVVITVVLISAVAAFVGACYLVKPLAHLVEALKRASNLELSRSDRKLVTRSRILEVEEIQADYLKLLRQLLVLRKFVPEAILARVDARSELDSTASASVIVSYEASTEQSTMFSGADVPAGTRGGNRNVKHDVRLNSDIFKEQLNVFFPKYCSLVGVEVHSPELMGDPKRFMSVLVATAAEHSGCIEVLGPERGVVTFGAHAPLPMHSSKGCRFAFDLFERLSPQEREAVSIVLDSNEFLVGTCGAHSRNARVLFGTAYLFELTKAMSGARCSIAATSGTASQLQDYQVFPIDCVLLSSSHVPIVLFELRPQRVQGFQMMNTLKHFRLGFAAMRQGYYKQAMTHYQRIGRSDLQAQRLIRLCAQRCLNRDSTPYIRTTGDLYNIGSTFNPPEEGTAMTGDLSLNDKKLHDTMPHKGGMVGENTVEDQNESSGENSTALFEMYHSSSSSESIQPSYDGGNGLDDVPLVLTDINQRVWTRSLKKISEGAFSAVFLGMSEDGVQVAIKCIPRRRRDIMQESLEAEMHIASKLRHPNVVQYVSCSVVQSHLAIIMEYLPGGSVYTVIKNFGKLSPRVARRFTVDILNGLNYLHGLGIVHCDVKPHNVLLGMDGVCKLSDFGSTISEAADMVRTMADEVLLRGTALYMAPEVACGGRCTAPSDMYSLGISLLEMLLGRPPWKWSGTAPEGSDAAGLNALMGRDALFVQSLARGHLEPEIPESLDPEAAIFVRSCCHADPAMRPSALELLSYAFIL